MAVGLTGHQRDAREKPKRPHIYNQHKTKDRIRPVEYFDAESRPALRQSGPGSYLFFKFLCLFINFCHLLLAVIINMSQ